MGSNRIRLASYNVHSWFGRDRRCDPERVVDVIRELGADVVALQEARMMRGETLTRPLDDLCEQEGYDFVEGPTFERGRASYGNAILSQLPIRRIAKLDLTVANREPRGAVSVEVDHHESETKIQFVTTHLGLRARERLHQTARLLEWLAGEVASGAPDLLSLAGDFNEWRAKGAALRRIEQAFGAVGAPRTFPSARPWFRLDRIWVLPRSALAGRVRVHRSRRARVASDHLPVVVDVELSGRSWRGWT